MTLALDIVIVILCLAVGAWPLALAAVALGAWGYALRHRHHTGSL